MKEDAEDKIRQYRTPSGGTLYVNDTVTVAQGLDRVLQRFRDGSGPLFFADAAGRPEGVVVAFRDWLEYEIEREDAEEQRRRDEVVRRLQARDPSRRVSYEEAAREGGWDPVVPSGPPDVEGDHRRRLQAALGGVITDGRYPLPDGSALAVDDIGTVGENLGALVERFRSGSTEQVFIAGDQSRPGAVILSFDQWCDYEEIKLEAEFDRRMYDLARERLATTDLSDLSQWETYEEMMARLGLDPDNPDLNPKAPGRAADSENS